MHWPWIMWWHLALFCHCSPYQALQTSHSTKAIESVCHFFPLHLSSPPVTNVSHIMYHNPLSVDWSSHSYFYHSRIQKLNVEKKLCSSICSQNIMKIGQIASNGTTSFDSEKSFLYFAIYMYLFYILSIFCFSLFVFFFFFFFDRTETNTNTNQTKQFCAPILYTRIIYPTPILLLKPNAIMPKSMNNVHVICVEDSL